MELRWDWLHPVMTAPYVPALGPVYPDAVTPGLLVWPTMVLAGKLDQSLAARSPGSAHAAAFRARYLDAGTRLALPAASGIDSDTDG